MNRTKKSMGIVIVATMALMFVVGSGLSSTQLSYAHGKSHKDTFGPKSVNAHNNGKDNKNKKDKNGPSDNRKAGHAYKNDMPTNAARKSQSLDQENHCIYILHCRNSNVAVQTQGNENSATAFADQSTNSNSTSFNQKPSPKMDTGSSN